MGVGRCKDHLHRAVITRTSWFLPAVSCIRWILLMASGATGRTCRQVERDHGLPRSQRGSFSRCTGHRQPRSGIFCLAARRSGGHKTCRTTPDNTHTTAASISTPEADGHAAIFVGHPTSRDRKGAAQTTAEERVAAKVTPQKSNSDVRELPANCRSGVILSQVIMRRCGTREDKMGGRAVTIFRTVSRRGSAPRGCNWGGGSHHSRQTIRRQERVSAKVTPQKNYSDVRELPANCRSGVVLSQVIMRRCGTREDENGGAGSDYFQDRPRSKNVCLRR